MKKETLDRMGDIGKLLFEDYKNLKNGKISIDEANSLSKLASQVVYAARVEVEVDRTNLAAQIRNDRVSLAVSIVQ